MKPDILSLGSSWKILDIFLRQPWKDFHPRELIRAASVSPNTAVNTLKDLKREGILISEGISNMVLYRLNPESELAKKALLLHHESRINSLDSEFKSYVEVLRRKLNTKKWKNKGILSVVLYGSVSRGTASKSSDIDIMIIYKRKDSGDSLGVFHNYPRHVQTNIFSETEFQNRYDYGDELIINIIRNGIIVHDNDFYYRYLLKLPKPTKEYIENMLDSIDEDLKINWEIYRKGKIETVLPLLSSSIIKLSRAWILTNKGIPESKYDIQNKLEKLGENKLAAMLKKARGIWEGKPVELSRKEIEMIMNFMEDKARECRLKLGDYDG